MARTDELPKLSIGRAAHCRSLANGALPYEVALELEALADEYDGRGFQPAHCRTSPVPRLHPDTEPTTSGDQMDGGKAATPVCDGADFLRQLARFFADAAKSATDPRAKQYSAERAFEVAQNAERLNRQRTTTRVSTG